MVGPRHNRRGSPGADLENLGRGEAAEEGFARVCGIRRKGPIPPCTLPLVKLGPRALMGTALASGALVGDQCRLAARPESEDRSRGALHPGRKDGSRVSSWSIVILIATGRGAMRCAASSTAKV